MNKGQTASEAKEKREIQTTPFDYTCRYSCAKLLYVLQQEPPETIAVVLCYMGSDKAAEVLEKLDSLVQSDVIKRISYMDNISPETIARIEGEIEEKLSHAMYIISDGVELASKILDKASSRNSRQIINKLKDEDENLADKIKALVFNFEDIVILDDRHLQKMFREIDAPDLEKALKLANAEVQEKCLRNMSRRAANMLKEDMEYMGPILQTDAEEAQEKIVCIIKRLESEGEIVISKHHEDHLIDNGISCGRVEHLMSLDDILGVSDSFIKKLISIFGVRFLAATFRSEENEYKIFEKLKKNMTFFQKRSFVKYWESCELLWPKDVAKEAVISLIKNESLIENTKGGAMYAQILKD